MKLKKLIVHAIAKTPDMGAGKLTLCQQEMQTDDSLDNFLNVLNSNFNSKLAKIHGAFLTNESSEQEIPQFNQLLKSYLNDQLSFVDFTHQSMDYLKNLMDRNGKTKGGFVVFARYELFATDFLFVIILHNQSALLIDDNLQLNQTEYLDTNSLYLAARIDLTQLKECSDSANNSTDEQQERYISMLIARDGKKINDYFREFIGFNITVDSKKETADLLSALSGFVNQSTSQGEVKEELKKKAVDYCTTQAETGENVNVKDFSTYVSDMAEEDFYRYLQSEKIELQDELTPDRSLLRKFNKISGRSGNLSISFPASLINQSVFYDSESDTLTIKNIPKSIRQQLLTIMKEEND